MANRITDKDLDNLCKYLNELTKNPVEQYKDGKACIGNYHISHAYGGVCLHRMVNENGGIRTILSSGHVPKRALWNEMHAFIKGLEVSA